MQKCISKEVFAWQAGHVECYDWADVFILAEKSQKLYIFTAKIKPSQGVSNASYQRRL